MAVSKVQRTLNLINLLCRLFGYDKCFFTHYPYDRSCLVICEGRYGWICRINFNPNRYEQVIGLRFDKELL